MTLKDVEFLFAYNRWANARTLDAVAALAPDAYTRDMGNSFGSVHDTLVHMYAAEWAWLLRWKGTSPAGLDRSGLSGLAALRARWSELERDQAGFVAGLTDADLERTLDYANTKGERFSNPLGRLIQHQINHSTYHRGQVTTMLRQLGAQAIGTDLVTFLRV